MNQIFNRQIPQKTTRPGKKDKQGEKYDFRKEFIDHQK